MSTQSPIIDPSTGKNFQPGSEELFVEVEATKVYNAGSKFSTDQIVFKCPFCDRRQRQNFRRAICVSKSGAAGLRCVCRRLVFVRRGAANAPQSRIISPYTR